MKLEYVKYAIDNVMSRKMRSFLTSLSILIGIAAIYALISFGQGLTNYVDELSSSVGSDMLMIQAKSAGVPGTDASFFIERKDLEFLEKVNGVDVAIGWYMSSIEVSFKDEKRYVFGASFPVDENADYFEKAFAMDLYSGRKLKNGDKFKAVLGYGYMFEDKIFSRAIKLRDRILINGHSFEVVGFYDTIGNPADDSNIYFTEEAFESLFPELKDKFQYGILRSSAGYAPSDVAEKAEEKLRKFKGQKEGKEDFFIQTFEEVVATFSIVIDVINAILALIALVSVIVAAVNIMNTMYTAVVERTKEIGIMKSVGAKNSDIMFIFIFESGLLGLVGGAGGIILGYLAAKLGGAIASISGYSMLQPYFPWQLTVGCLLFAFVIGAGAGFFPARQAAKLKPVDALRYE